MARKYLRPKIDTKKTFDRKPRFLHRGFVVETFGRMDRREPGAEVFNFPDGDLARSPCSAANRHNGVFNRCSLLGDAIRARGVDRDHAIGAFARWPPVGNAIGCRHGGGSKNKGKAGGIGLVSARLIRRRIMVTRDCDFVPDPR